MKKVSKMTTILGLMFLLTMNIMADDTLAGSATDEATGFLKLIKLVILIVILLAAVFIPYKGQALATSIAKKKLENNQEEDAGWKVMGFGILGAFAGIFVIYIFLGFLGSMFDPTNTDGEILFTKGIHYLLSTTFSDIQTVASGTTTATK